MDRFNRAKSAQYDPELRTMIQLSDVRVFLEILSTGSFTAAAKALQMPKSSVARQIARLEAEVGCRLLRRTSRSVALTDEGRSFVPHARRLLDDGIEAENVLRTKGKGASGLLTVSATALVGRAFLAPHLPAFLARNPNVQVALWLSAARLGIGSSLGEVDIAIRLRAEGAAQMGSRKLGQFDFCLVAAPAYLKKRRAPRMPADLQDHHILELSPPGKINRMELLKGGKSFALRYSPALQIDDPEAVRMATLAGGGISVLPTFLVADDIGRGALVHVLEGWAPASIPVSVLYRTDVGPSLRVRAFLDFLFETFEQNPPWRIDPAESPVR